MSARDALRLALFATAALAPACALAQPGAAAPAPSPSAGVPAVGELVVTARRREERIQDVPVAISAATGATLEKMNIDKPDELTRIAPGMVVDSGVYGGANLNVTIRSQRQALNNATYDQSVVVYFAEVPQARTQGLNSGFFDIDSVQVLKGPQGTLFGRNTTGGALLITPKAPAKDFEGYLQGTAGNYSLVDLEGALNVPVNDKLQIRLAGKSTRHDGYDYSVTAHTGLNDEDTQSWRASIRFAPTDNIVNTLVVNGFNESDSGTSFKIVDINPDSPIAKLHGWFAQWQLLQTQPFHTTTASNGGAGTNIKTFGLSNITTVDLGVGTLKNVFGYRHVNATIDWNIQGDIDNTYHLIAIDRGDQYSDELNFSGKALDNNLDYIGGLFWFKENAYSSQFSLNGFGLSSAALAALPPAGFTIGQPGGRTVADTLADPIENLSYSAYAQATYKVPAMPKLSLTGGLRYTYDERKITWRNVFLYTPPGNGPACRLVDSAGRPLDPCIRQGEANWARPTWTLSADYKVNDDVLVYIAHRHGYRSGGFTFTAYNPTEAQPYAPEIVNDVELGAKTIWRPTDDSRLLVNIAAYYQDYKDIQRNVTVPPPGGVGSVATYFKNAAAASVKGVEVESNFDIGRNLQLAASFAYSDAAYSSFVVPGLGDFTKAPFAGAPKYTATWMARYRVLNSDEHGDVFLQANGYYQSSTVPVDGTTLNQKTITINVNGTPTLVPAQTVYPWDIIEARHIVDVSLEWNRVMGSKLDLQLFAKNVFDHNYYQYLQDGLTSLGSVQGTLGAPRTYGVTARYAF